MDKNGNKINYFSLNQGNPPVILLHGICDNGLCWLPIANVLSKEYDVIMPDARGHGSTEVADNIYSFKSMADDIRYIINKLNIRNVNIIGHSMGGHIAAVVAVEYPERIKGIILEDPAFILRKPSFITKNITKILMNIETYFLLKGNYEDILDRCKKHNPNWSEVACESWVKAKIQLKSKDPKNLQKIMINPYDWKELIPQISCKLLLLISEKGLISEKKAKKIINLSQDGKYVKIMGAGHYIHHDQFEKYLIEIKDFLK